MADQILDAIIQLENQIEQQLQTEEAKAETWLAGVRREQETAFERVQQELREENQHSIEQAASQAELQAETRLKNEMEYCRRLEEISQYELLEVLRRQLVKILPRQVDDHQNGQS